VNDDAKGVLGSHGPRLAVAVVIACVLGGAAPAAAAPVRAFAARGGSPATAAPFVYTANHGRNDVSQFAAPLAGHEALRPLTPRAVAAGSFPIAVAVSPRGTTAYVVNTNGNTISQYRISPATGKLRPLSPATVAASGSGGAAISPDGDDLYVTTLDNAVAQYRINPATGKLSPRPAIVAAGKMPDAVAVAPDGRSAYVTNIESKSISQYRIHPATGKLTPLSPAAVATGSSPGAVAVSPDGKDLYVALDNAVAQYRINPATGKLSPKPLATVATGPGPNAIAITPDGKNAYTANVVDRTISRYRIDPVTGKLTVKSLAAAVTGRGPQAIAITPDGRSAYVANENDGTVSQYTIDPANGKISSKTPATVHAASGSEAVAVTPDADASARISAPITARHRKALTYTIKITSAGPSKAWRAALTDHLPAGTAFRSATSTSGTCSTPRPGTRGATVRCLLATLRAGGAWRIKITVAVKASTGTIRNKATVASVTPDPRPGNNVAGAATKIIR